MRAHDLVVPVTLVAVVSACATTEQQPGERLPKKQVHSPPASRHQAQPSRTPAQTVVPQREDRPGSHVAAIASIAAAIERLKGDYPQLADFSADKHCDHERLVVSYGYHTHRARHRGGWTSGVPNPDADGLWFYVDFHDPDSTAQIHTQPVVPDLRHGDKKVMVLILEGKRTKPLAPALDRILREHGVRPGP